MLLDISLLQQSSDDFIFTVSSVQLSPQAMDFSDIEMGDPARRLNIQ